MKLDRAAVRCAAMGFLAVGWGSVATSASAQSLNPALDPYRGESRLSAAITLPLGQSSDHRRTAPRAELVSQMRFAGETTIFDRDQEHRWQERRIGLTLDGSNALMINGRPVDPAQNRANLDTIEVVAIAGGALLVVSAIAFAAYDPDFTPQNSPQTTGQP